MIPPAQLRRAADCAYQIGLAYLEGFGTARSDATALEWIRIAAEWGSHRGQADYLAIASTLELAQDSTVSVSSAQAVMPVFWTAKAVSERGDSVAATFLSRHPRAKSICTSTIQKYRDTYTLQCWKEFEELIGLTREDLFGDSECTTLRSYFSVEDMSHIFKIGNGWSLLHYAVLSGQLSAVKFLVEKLDADVRCLSWHSETPLDIAIANGNSTMIDYLLDRHENARPHFKVGSCPLQNIAFLPANLIPDIVFRILSRSQPIGIDVRSEATARTALMNTMLIEAPLYPESRRTAAETLISFGANPLLTTAEAGTASPLLLVVQQLDCDLVKVMLNAISTNEHVIPLVDQARTRPEPCNELARSFFKLMQTPRSVRVTVGVTNYKNSYSEMVRLLMKEGIATELPYACRTSKHDPLGLACYYGNDEAAAAMLDISPEINSQFQNTLIGDPGLDALLTAVGCGFAETIDILLPRMMARNNVAEYNVLVSAVHHQPALIPKIYSHFERAGKGQKLLSYVDPWGATALDTALEYELMDLANFLLEKGATYDEYRLKGDHSIDEGKQFTFASVLPRMKPVKFLMELNPKPRLVVTESGLNVFHILALDEKLIGTSVGRSEFLSIMDYFYALDPSLVHARGGTKSLTPFHIVSLQYSEIVANFLHKNGADINVLDSEGNTPLDVLEFHDAGDRPPAQRLTIDYSGTQPRTGLAICDYALAGPAYWIKEGKMAMRIKELYLSWDAKRSNELRGRRQEPARELDLSIRELIRGLRI